MAKKKEKAVEQAAASTEVVTVAILAEKLEVEARVLRQFIRAQGFKAPEVTNQEGFGPRAKYEWPANSPELKQIIDAWQSKAKKEA